MLIRKYINKFFLNNNIISLMLILFILQPLSLFFLDTYTSNLFQRFYILTVSGGILFIFILNVYKKRKSTRKLFFLYLFLILFNMWSYSKSGDILVIKATSKVLFSYIPFTYLILDGENELPSNNRVLILISGFLLVFFIRIMLKNRGVFLELRITGSFVILYLTFQKLNNILNSIITKDNCLIYNAPLLLTSVSDGVLLLLLGSRTAQAIYIALILLFIVCFTVITELKKTRIIKVVTIAALSITLIVLFLINNGVDLRIVRVISEGQLFNSNGRNDIYNSSLSIIKNYPYGLGFMGERRINYLNLCRHCDGNYYSYFSHNVLLEILTTFGIFLGSIISIRYLYLFLKINKNLLKKKGDFKMKVFNLFQLNASFLVGFSPLIVTSSFMNFRNFWLHLGVLMRLYYSEEDCNVYNLERHSPLFITTTYIPKAHANGLCVHKVVTSNEAKKNMEKGITGIVYLANDKKQIKGQSPVKLYRVKPSYIDAWKINHNRSKIVKLLMKLRRVILLPLYPISSVINIKKLYFKSKKAFEMENYSHVISTCNSIETLVAGYLLSVKMNIPLYIYQLDSLRFGYKNNLIPTWFHDIITFHWEKKFYNHAEKIILLESMKEQYSVPDYDAVKHKLHYTGIPFFDTSNWCLNENTNLKNKKDLSLLYAGALQNGLREPNYSFEFFEYINLNSHLKINYELYQRGYTPSKNFISNHIQINDYIPYVDLKNKVMNADILVSIGNKNTNMLPSKIFEYMSTGKKIVHFVSDDRDSAIFYLKKYSNALILYEKETINNNLKLFIDFLNKTTFIDKSQLELEFYTESPKYTYKLLYN